MLLDVLVRIIVGDDGRLAGVNLVGVHDDLVDVVGLDLPADRVLDTFDIGVDLGIDVLAVFEGQVGVKETAVLQGQVLGITEALVTLDRTVDQGDVVGVPGQVLPVQGGRY